MYPITRSRNSSLAAGSIPAVASSMITRSGLWESATATWILILMPRE